MASRNEKVSRNYKEGEEIELNERQRRRLEECFGPYVRMCVIIKLIKDTPELRAELMKIK